jgi:hypothetical protein
MSGLGLANPAGALAFAALAALVLLHLRRRRRDAVPVATLFLWRRVRAPLVDRRRVRPDALFWLQAAALFLLAAAYVRPWVTGGGPSGAARLAVVLDVSASMQAREAEGVRFELARARALASLAAAAGEVMLVTAGPRPAVALRWSDDRALARRRLEEMEALDVPGDLAPALELAVAEADARPGTRVLVLTDRPPEEHGAAAADRALEWVRIGRRDDNVAVAGLSIEAPPFAGAAAARVLAVVRSYARTPRRVVLDARAGGAPWARRDLELAAGAMLAVPLPAPPAGGALEVAVDAGDALAVDDRAWGWLAPGGPLDAVVATRSAAVADLFARLAAASGGRATVVAPEGWTAAAAAGHRVAVLDGFVPPAAPETAGTLYAAPPPGSVVCPAAGRAEDVRVVDWDATHPLLRGTAGLQSPPLPAASVLAVPAWGRAVVLGATPAAGFPLLVAGERDGRRVACLAPALGDDLLASDHLPLLLVALAALRWVGDAGAALDVATGDAVAVPTGTTAAPGVRIAGEPPVLVAERTGVHRLATPAGERIVAANLFDERESDLRTGAAPGGSARAPRGRGAAAGAAHEAGPWLLGLALVALLAEWRLWLRSAVP